MKRVLWSDRVPGDLMCCGVPGGAHDAIWHFEKADHPNAPIDFPVSHIAIYGPAAGIITEAWESKVQDSVASLNPDSKYAPAAAAGEVEVWRFQDATEPEIAFAFASFLKIYAARGYGFLNLFGFAWRAVVKEVTGVDVENPIEVSSVCSQGAIEWARMLTCQSAQWAVNVDVRDLDPLAMRMLLLANETRTLPKEEQR